MFFICNGFWDVCSSALPHIMSYMDLVVILRTTRIESNHLNASHCNKNMNDSWFDFLKEKRCSERVVGEPEPLRDPRLPLKFSGHLVDFLCMKIELDGVFFTRDGITLFFILGKPRLSDNRRRWWRRWRRQRRRRRRRRRHRRRCLTRFIRHGVSRWHPGWKPSTWDAETRLLVMFLFSNLLQYLFERVIFLKQFGTKNYKSTTLKGTNNR